VSRRTEAARLTRFDVEPWMGRALGGSDRKLRLPGDCDPVRARRFSRFPSGWQWVAHDDDHISRDTTPQLPRAVEAGGPIRHAAVWQVNSTSNIRPGSAR
jgi:hypothetical protein